MKKILYLMGIDWYWIKQRPQIIAEMLAQDYDITVAYYKEVFVKQSLRKDKDELEKSISIPAIPFRDKNSLAYGIQKYFFRKVMRNIDKYDMVWLAHPLLYRYIPKSCHGKVVYDCMDNHEALCNDKKIAKSIQVAEKELVHRADVIFASSGGLLNKVIKLGGLEKAHLVRNGVVLKEIHSPLEKNIGRDGNYNIGYFGTIAEWFDFTLLLESLEKFPGLTYHLWGPVSNIKPPKHPRMILEGVVEHRCLWDKVKNMDCLIMPFKVNDIIRDVDPVKLYEYISMGKPIISVWYEEVERFGEFVTFYKSRQEFFEAILKVKEDGRNCKYISESQRTFLANNSWEVRYNDIRDKISNDDTV